MKNNQLKMGVVLTYVSQILNVLVVLLYTPILLRLLGQGEYGVYQLVFSVVSYLGLLNFGFGSSYVRFYTRYKSLNSDEKVAKLNGLFMLVFLGMSILSLISGIGLLKNIETVLGDGLTVDEMEIAKVLMSFLVANIAITFPSSVFNSYITANEKFIFQRIVVILQKVLNPFIALPLLFMGYRSVSLVIAITVVSIMQLVCYGYYSITKLNMKFYFKELDWKLLREVWSFSFFIFINLIVNQINWSIDKFILGRYLGANSVAIYAIGGQINTIYVQISTAVSAVFIPRINKMVSENQDNKELTSLFTRVGRIQFIILSYVIIGFIVLGKYFIENWAGKNYRNSYYVTLLLIIPVTIPLIQNLGIEIQRAKNKHKFRSYAYLIIAMTNVFLTIQFVQAFGVIGAALGTAIALMIGNVFIMNWYYNSKIKLDIGYFWKSISKLLPVIILNLVVFIVIEEFIHVNSILKFVIVGGIYTIIYAITIFKFGMNDIEQKLITIPLNKVYSKVRWN